MIIHVNGEVQLELINTTHAKAIFSLVQQNRSYLSNWLTFVDTMQTISNAKNFVLGSMQRNAQEIDYAFVIRHNSEIVGRIGVYKMNANKIGEIGYWLAENAQGKGIILNACVALIDFCFFYLKLNRIEIKCGVGNLKSKSIPEKLKFTKEGILREAELLNGQFIDLQLYSLLKTDYVNLSTRE
jgi:ribosomal-protein-serine acetyltransferase